MLPPSRFHTYLAQYITDLANSEHPRTPDAVIPIEWVPEDIARVQGIKRLLVLIKGGGGIQITRGVQ